MADEILYEVDGDGIATITMNRPERLNAMNRPFVDQLHDRVEEAAFDTDVRVVVLTGAGRGFCSGGDMKGDQPTSQDLPLAARISRGRRTIDTSRILHDMGKPVIGMINGPVAGAGIGLAGACDLRFASESATFTTAFNKRGYSGDYGACYLWTKILGSGKTRELFMLGETVNAQQGLALGLFNRVFPVAELKTRTYEVARNMAANYDSCWRLMKSSLNAAEDQVLETAFDVEVNNMVLSMQIVRDIVAAKAAG